MKNIIKFGVPIILLLGIYISGIYLFDSPSDVVVGLYNGDKKEIDTSNTLAIMYENDNGEYVESTSSNWLGDGYIFNESLSKCKNGSKIYYDSATKKVMVEANTNDRCYVYFDAYSPNFVEYLLENIYVSDGVNGLYYHDGVGPYTNADQEAGDNSYRYSGANPNNYVCFGSDADTCPDEYLYRIVGVFDDDKDGVYNVKLIKADYTTSDMLGTDGNYYGGNDYTFSYYKGSMNSNEVAAYRWNYDTSEYESNYWATSELNKINLNTNYINYLGSSWSNMIKDSTWYLGTFTYDEFDNYTVKQFYNGERNNGGYGSNPTTYNAKIGLIYVSEFGYASDVNDWNLMMSNYFYVDEYSGNNWLYMGLYEWTITSISTSYSNIVIDLSNKGGLNASAVDGGFSVRPVFYLKSNISYVEGNGTKDSPFRIN